MRPALVSWSSILLASDLTSSYHFQVINYESRPTMKFTPAPNATDRRILHFNYIRAITKLPINFSEEELAPIYKIANSSTELHGKLREVFVVLHDDVAKALSRSAQNTGSKPSGPASVLSGANSVPVVPQPSGSRSGRDSRSSRSSTRMEHDRSRSRSPLGALNPS